MKRKIKITSQMVKRVVLIVLAVAVVGLLVFVTIESFNKDIVSSNSDIPAASKISGEYAKYIASYKDAEYPENVKVEAVLNQDDTDAYNIAEGTDTYTGKTGQFKDLDGTMKSFVYSGKTGALLYDVNIPKAGFYNILVNYVGADLVMNGDSAHTWEESGGADIEREISINGKVPFDDLLVVSFTRTWHDGGEKQVDINGNEIKPKQVELQESNSAYVRDSIGYVTEPYLVYFNAGQNVIKFESVKENMGIISIYVMSKEQYQTYDAYIAQYNDAKKVSNVEPIKIEAENAYARSSSTIYAISDKTSLYTTTTDAEGKSHNASPLKQILNVIGGNKWTSPGSWISWSFEVPETGLYEISLRCKQNVSRGLFSTRKLYIDNEVPFSEAQNCKFVYKSDYSVVTLGKGEDDPFLFYLEAGKHTISLECTLGDYASLISDVQDVIDTLNEIYRGIIKRTGISPDPYINYFGKEEGQKFIQEATLKFQSCMETLQYVSEEITRISGEKSSEAASLETMMVQLEQFIKSYRKIQRNLSDFSTNISALGTWILNVSEQALTIDYIEVHSTDYNLHRANPNLFVGLWFGIRGFFGSFFTDYESVGISSVNENWEEVEVWLMTSESTGREQANAISSMIYEAQTEAADNPNSPLYGINVRLKVVSSGVLLTATLANRGPDVAINVANGTPVNYALRGAIHDLSGYIKADKEKAASEGRQAVIDRFSASSITPYKYRQTKKDANGNYVAASTSAEGLQEGIYALPYTQSYLVMFYRTDMFAEYGWDVPETWDQVLQLIPELQIMNFQFYLPLNQVGATSVVNQIYASYLYQSVENPTQAFYRTIPYQTSEGYWKEYIESNFDSEESMKAFEFWCSFYTDYSFPLAASFINRFRSGETPIGIAGFDMYNTLAVSAPEIKGKWAFALLPGIEKVNDNGDPYVDHTGATSGTCLVMMEQPSKLSEAEKQAKYDASWKFMDWFTSADTQVGYAREIEAILGSAARLNTANIEAFDRLAWTKKDLEVLDLQREGNENWVGTIGVPEVPGGYYTGRNLENAFRYVVNNNENPRQTLTDYILSINNEINRKREEFGLGTVNDYKSTLTDAGN